MSASRDVSRAERRKDVALRRARECVGPRGDVRAGGGGRDDFRSGPPSARAEACVAELCRRRTGGASTGSTRTSSRRSRTAASARSGGRSSGACAPRSSAPSRTPPRTRTTTEAGPGGSACTRAIYFTARRSRRTLGRARGRPRGGARGGGARTEGGVGGAVVRLGKRVRGENPPGRAALRTGVVDRERSSRAVSFGRSARTLLARFMEARANDAGSRPR